MVDTKSRASPSFDKGEMMDVSLDMDTNNSTPVASSFEGVEYAKALSMQQEHTLEWHVQSYRAGDKAILRNIGK